MVLRGCLGAVAVVAALVAERTGGRWCRRRRGPGVQAAGVPGSGYFIALSVRGTSCATGRRLALAYHRCRVRDGGRDAATSGSSASGAASAARRSRPRSTRA